MTGLNERALDRAREHIARLTEQQRADAHEQRRNEMTHARLTHGLAKKPPAIKDETLDDWHGKIAVALDAARQAERVERDLESTSPIEPGRFAALDKGAGR